MKILHPLESLGVVKATRGEIRVEKLQDRLLPKVPFPHRHDFFQLVFLEEASGWHQLDFEKHTAHKFQLYIIKPGQIHGWNFHSKTKGFIVEFTKESLRKTDEFSAELISKTHSLPDLLKFKSDRDRTEIQSLIEAMTLEFSRQAAVSPRCLQNYLEILLVHLVRLAPEVSLTLQKKETTVEKFRTLLEENFHREHSVEFYARELGLSANALTMRISRSLSKSARHCIQERVLLEAKRLLAYSNIPVADVGYRLGYEDPNYFSRFFHEHVGLAPLKFRQKAHLKN